MADDETKVELLEVADRVGGADVNSRVANPSKTRDETIAEIRDNARDWGIVIELLRALRPTCAPLVSEDACGSSARAFTVEEMRERFIAHLEELARYWAKTDLERPEFRQYIAEKGETLYRIEGFLHSLLVTLDGGSADLPRFNLTPSPHPDDKAFCQSQGENWWPDDNRPINLCQLHELFAMREKR